MNVRVLTDYLMERRFERDLEALTAIGEGRPLSQRALAQRLGVALGLTNLIVRRLAKKGYIKIMQFPRKPAAGDRLRYLLTPKGVLEKTRLTYEHAAYALKLYRRARQTLRDSLNLLAETGLKRIALYGTGEAAELAYLTLKEFGREPVGVFFHDGGGSFLGLPVRPAAQLAREDLDAVIVATFEWPQRWVVELERLGLAPGKILTLRRMERLPVAGRSAP